MAENQTSQPAQGATPEQKDSYIPGKELVNLTSDEMIQMINATRRLYNESVQLVRGKNSEGKDDIIGEVLPQPVERAWYVLESTLQGIHERNKAAGLTYSDAETRDYVQAQAQAQAMAPGVELDEAQAEPDLTPPQEEGEE